MEEEINILDYWKVIWERRNVIIIIVCVALITASVATILAPRYYRAETTLLLPQRGGSSALSSFVSGLPISLPMDITASILGRRSNFIDILESYALAEIVVDGLKLELEREFPKIKSKSSLTGLVQGTVKAKTEKGVITISVETQNPRLSADLANYFVLALDKYNQKSNLQVARRTRAFIREQLAKAKVDLNLAEDRLRRFKTESILVRMSEKELRLARLGREVNIKEALYTMLLQEYEKAKIEEEREGMFFEVLDSAKVSNSPCKPRIKLTLAIAGLLSLFVGVFAAFFQEYLEGIKGKESSS